MNVTGRKSFINDKPAVASCISSLYRSSEGAVIDVAPKVIFESLARYRPIIVFEEIKHVKENLKGIFVCKRQNRDLEKKILYIMNNYNNIVKDIKKNKIHTKKQFQNKLNIT